MRQLPSVALCCVDTRLPDLALRAMTRSMQHIAFAEALLFTDPKKLTAPPPPGIQVIPADIPSSSAYSTFLLSGILPYLTTSHHLVVQWDGYVTNDSMWTDQFLELDYIGAVWPQFKDDHRVGNGGFSLRSKRLIESLQDPCITRHHPEDLCIGRTNRSTLENRFHIRFADEALARQFSIERETRGKGSFGFHGLSNLAHVEHRDQLAELISTAPQDIFRSTECRQFIKNLLATGHRELAKQAYARRTEDRLPTMADLRLLSRILLSPASPNP